MDDERIETVGGKYRGVKNDGGMMKGRRRSDAVAVRPFDDERENKQRPLAGPGAKALAG
jgi:hypothetical protein